MTNPKFNATQCQKILQNPPNFKKEDYISVPELEKQLKKLGLPHTKGHISIKLTTTIWDELGRTGEDPYCWAKNIFRNGINGIRRSVAKTYFIDPYIADKTEQEQQKIEDVIMSTTTDEQVSDDSTPWSDSNILNDKEIREAYQTMAITPRPIAEEKQRTNEGSIDTIVNNKVKHFTTHILNAIPTATYIKSKPDETGGYIIIFTDKQKIYVGRYDDLNKDGNFIKFAITNKGEAEATKDNILIANDVEYPEIGESHSRIMKDAIAKHKELQQNKLKCA